MRAIRAVAVVALLCVSVAGKAGELKKTWSVGEESQITDSEKPEATPSESGREFFRAATKIGFPSRHEYVSQYGTFAIRESWSPLAAAKFPLRFLASHE